MWGILGVAVGGALGSVARYGVGHLALRLLGSKLPFGTLAVNVIGSFSIGLAVEYSFLSLAVSRLFRLTCAVGFLGGFTTFSTFSFETMGYLKEGAYFFASLNILLNVILGLAATWLGLATMRSIT